MDTAVYVKNKGHVTRFTSVRCNDTQDAQKVIVLMLTGLVLWKVLARRAHHLGRYA